MENLNKSIDELIDSITNIKEYNNVINIKKKMNDNDELLKLISDVKNLQKKYIKSNYDGTIKQELEEKEKILNEIPIYIEYNENLKIVNEMISVVTENLNEYFYKKLNSD